MEHQLTRIDLWIAILGGACVIIAAILTVQLTFHRQNKEEAEKQRQQTNFILREHSPHSHTEDEGEPLNERGIRYPANDHRRGA